LREGLATLDGAGYFKQGTPESFSPRLHEILDKMDISDRDVEILRGMFRLLARTSASS
jgi:tRNA C32,U32 (ribose-2'-O)-methylase TrmJ